MSISGIFTKANGQLLKAGAYLNSKSLCSFAMGKTNVFNNSAALRIAAEGKNYKAFSTILNKATDEGGGFATTLDFGLGQDWNRVEDLAKTDDILSKSLLEYEARADQRMDALFEEIPDLTR
ncbi:MAG: hypothetical protein CMH27_02230 [Micavibrio sp.]|nr:hypothetical protein [Micavibrio sp.]|tara:strand:+ start:384 stop:749 length:366 start_codon:yes stop_codon:yes gene_type:complete